MDVLTVAAVCFRDEAGRVLTVRKRGTEAFMLPGGKLEAGEAPIDCAVREVHEELGIALTAADLTHLVSWRGAAANEANTDIESTVYVTGLRVQPAAAAEIAEARWLDPADHGEVTLAPMLSQYLFPRLNGA